MSAANGFDLRPQHFSNCPLSGGRAAYWFGYSAILRGDVFGMPFGWGFGTALTLAAVLAPLAFDRDDPSLIAGHGILGGFAILILSAAGLGAGLVRFGTEPLYDAGAVIGPFIGFPLSYWAFGKDREERGCPRR